MLKNITETIVLALEESCKYSAKLRFNSQSSSLLFHFAVSNLGEIFAFTEFQINLLQTFSFILFCNIVLIIIFWGRYGQTISSHFIRSSTLIEIERLRKSVEKLKLPREHTARI